MPAKQSVEDQRLKQTWGIIAAFALLALLLDISFNAIISKHFRDAQKVSVSLELGTLRSKLEERLNSSFFIVHGMAAAISINPEIPGKDFNLLAGMLLSQNHCLKNIAAAPDFVIRYVYPLEGNEALIGMDFRKEADPWTNAQESKVTGKITIAGPMKLMQGGTGLIARFPVFTLESNTFWGLVSSVIDFEKLVIDAGLGPGSNSLSLAIRKKDGKGETGEIFFGDQGIFNPQVKALKMEVPLPYGAWEMAAVPKIGWRDSPPYTWSIHLFAGLIALTGCFITIQQRRRRYELVENTNQLRAMSNASLDALIVIDDQDLIRFWNASAQAMFGYTEAEVIGKSFHDLVALPQDMENIRKGMELFIKNGQGPVMNKIMEMDARRKSGEVFPVERSVASFKFKERWYAVGSVRDITARKQIEKQLVELATTDGLTGLYNRRYFIEKAEGQLLQANRYDRSFSLLMFDLDHFKSINDTYGHDAGDLVLKSVAETVRQTLRETDIIGRVGGEEFMVAMPETDIGVAWQAAERIRIALMASVVETGKETIQFSVSIGLAHRASSDMTLAKMMKIADNALYKAKQGGRNRVESG